MFESKQVIEVASAFDMSTPAIGTLAEVIQDTLPGVQHKNCTVWPYQLAEWIAMLTEESLYGETAWPKTDYMIIG